MNLKQAAMFSVAIVGMNSGITQAGQVTEYWATIQVQPTKQDSRAWDALGGAPDVALVVEGTRYFPRSCRDSYKCEIKFTSKESSWYFEIYDRDAAYSDLIGNGTCGVGQPCWLGQAEITVNKQPAMEQAQAEPETTITIQDAPRASNGTASETQDGQHPKIEAPASDQPPADADNTQAASSKEQDAMDEAEPVAEKRPERLPDVQESQGAEAVTPSN